MQQGSRDWIWHVDGPAVYAACIALAAAPIYGMTWSADAVVAYAALAASALLIQELIVAKGWHRHLADPHAVTLKTLLGILVCTAGYAWVSPAPRPQFLMLSLMWLNLGLTRLSPSRVLALFGIYIGIVLFQCGGSLGDPAAPLHGDDLFVLCVSVLYAGFLYARVYRYEWLRSRSRRSLEVLHRAEERIRDITETDPETGALRLPYFRARLQRHKQHAQETDHFCVAMLEVDQYDELMRDAGPAVTIDVLRQFALRVGKVVHKEDTRGCTGLNAPIGRVRGGRFALLLAGWNFAEAALRLEHLHQAADLQAIRLGRDVCRLTLSIGFAEHDERDTIDETVARATRALELARAHNGNDIIGLRRPPEKALPSPGSVWDSRLTARH
jgi:GGDEF domain-containing protein